MWGKRRFLGEEEERTNLGGRESVETYSKCKN